MLTDNSRVAKTAEWALYAFVFLLPWQTRWIAKAGELNGGWWEYDTLSFYAVEVVLVTLLVMSLASWLPRRKGEGGRRRRGRPQATGHRGWQWLVPVAAVLFGAWAVFSMIWAVDWQVAMFAVIKLAEATLLFLVVRTMKLDYAKLALAFVAAGVLQAVLGAFQFFTQSVLASTLLGIASHGPDVLGDIVVETGQGRFLRAYGAFPHPNMLGGFLAIAMLFCMGLYTEWKDQARRLVAAIALPFLTGGLVLSFSRSAWVALAVALVVLLILTLRKHKDAIMLPMFVALVSLAAFALVFWPQVSVRLAGVGRLEAVSIGERVSQLEDFKRIAADHWLLGTGLNNYTAALYAQDPDRASYAYQPIHNIYALILAELGIAGILLFVIVMVIVMVAALLGQRPLSIWTAVAATSLIVLLTIGLFDHYLTTLATGTWLLWLVMGLASRHGET